MKRFLPFVTFSLFTFLFFSNSHAGANDGLIIHFPFDTDVRDAVTENLPTIIGIEPVLVEGKLGSAARFNGNEIFSFSYQLQSSPATPFTVATWIKTDQPNRSRNVLLTQSTGCMPGLDDRWDFSIYGDTHELVASSQLGRRHFDSGFVNDQDWHHIAYVWDGVNLRVHVDGIAQAPTREFAYTPPFTSSAPPLGIGGQPISNCGQANRTMVGELDDVRIYDRALSSQEIDDLFNWTPPLQIACEGFEAPLDISPVSVRGNRALPFKAQLVYEEMYLTDLDIVASPVIQIMFTSGDDPDAIDVTDELLSVGHGTDGNEFVYTDDDKWQINKKVSKKLASGTYTASMVSGDETEYVIDPICEVEFVIK